MTRATVCVMALIAFFPSAGSAQAAPSPGDRIRIRQVDGTVLTGTLATWSTETVQLFGESVDRRMEVSLSAIEALEMSLGQERSFGKYYVIALGVSTVVGGIVGFTRASGVGIGGSRSSSYYRGRSTGGGLLVGYMVGVPLGVFIGSRVTEERWNPVAIPGPTQSGPTIRPVIGSELGLSAGQRIRVRAADALSVEGVFVGFDEQNMLLSTTQAGQDQRVAIDRLQALWVRERNTKKGAQIGAITGGVFLTGVILYLKEYVLDHPENIGLGYVVASGVIGASLGAAVGSLIGYLVQGWSPVWP